MKLLEIFVCASVASLLLVGCSPACPPQSSPVTSTETPIDTQTVEQAVRAVFDASFEGWNKGDIVAYMQAFEQSDSLRTIDGARCYYGWQRGVDAWLKDDPHGEYMGTATNSTVLIDVVGPDAALVYNEWLIVAGTDSMTGASSSVFQHLPVGWRITHSHTSYGR